MSFSEGTVSLDPSRGTTALAKKLLVTWGCALLFGWGVYLPVFFIAAAVVAAMASFGSWEASGFIALSCVLGLLTMLPGPVLLGAYLSHSWRQGIVSGLPAVIVGAVGLVVFYQMFGLLGKFVQDGGGEPGLSFSMLAGLTSAVVVATVFLIGSMVSPRRRLALGFGLIVGIGLSFVSGLAIGPMLRAGADDFHLIWQSPPLVWVSTLYFSELIENRAGWKDFIVWLALVLVTFGLPFVLIPILPSFLKF